jgi:hypothetical protein
MTDKRTEAERQYYGHCPKCGTQLGFGHLPEECTVGVRAREEELVTLLKEGIKMFEHCGDANCAAYRCQWARQVEAVLRERGRL